MLSVESKTPSVTEVTLKKLAILFFKMFSLDLVETYFIILIVVSVSNSVRMHALEALFLPKKSAFSK